MILSKTKIEKQMAVKKLLWQNYNYTHNLIKHRTPFRQLLWSTENHEGFGMLKIISDNVSNSSPIDELWELVPNKVGGGPAQVWGTAGGFHGNSESKNQPCHRLPTSEQTLVEILTYHSTYLALTSNEGGKGRVVNLIVKQHR